MTSTVRADTQLTDLSSPRPSLNDAARDFTAALDACKWLGRKCAYTRSVVLIWSWPRSAETVCNDSPPANNDVT